MEEEPKEKKKPRLEIVKKGRPEEVSGEIDHRAMLEALGSHPEPPKKKAGKPKLAIVKDTPPSTEKPKGDYVQAVIDLGHMKRGTSEQPKPPHKDIPHKENSED